MESGQRFNLVLMDVQMPNLDGIQSTKRIREIGFSAPIVALTAFAEESNIKDCYDSGMDFFLPKPIRRPELKKVLSKYCPTIHEEEVERAGPSVSKMNGVRSSRSAEKK
jgi:osomolarity two-component system, sensor histidine kinase SLN1